MKKMIAVPLVLAVLTAGIALRHATSQAETPAKPGESVEVFDDPSFAAEQGKVEFSHLKHKEIFGQEKLDCKPCHMTKPAPLFSMKKQKEGETHQVIRMSEMAKGKACGGCHDGETTINERVAFDLELEENCSRCHLKE